MALTCAHYLSTSRGGDYLDHRAKIYHRLMLQGKLRLAVRWITEGDKGGVFQTGDMCPKTS